MSVEGIAQGALEACRKLTLELAARDAEIARLRALLREYVVAHSAFRSAPIGAPNSQARAEQDAAIDLEDRARAALDGP